jgi:hypothetical protein
MILNTKCSFIIVITVIHNFIKIHDKKDKGFKWDFDNLESNDEEEMKVVHDNITRSICGL